MKLSRRTFLKLSAAGLVGAVVIERAHDTWSESSVRGKIVIIGGGAAGITMAAHLADRLRHDDITIIEPESMHRYQPGYTLIAAGIFQPSEIERPTAALMPTGVKWLKDRVVALEPDRNRVITAANGPVGYDFLVVAPGCQVDFNLVEGITAASLGSGGAHSIYDFVGAQRCGEAMRKLPAMKEGRLVFTDTYTKMKCGGAPKKIALLTEDLLRRNGVRERFVCTYFNNDTVLMKPKPFGDRLEAIYAARAIELRPLHRLASIDPVARKAVFHRLPKASSTPLPAGHTFEAVTMEYDFLHFVPPMAAPDFVRDSPLVPTEQRLAGGWVPVDKGTLVHARYQNVIALGDVAGIPASKTGAAIRMQAPVAAANLISLMEGREPGVIYNGYSACPIITEYGKLMMCEFGYDEKLLPTIPFLDPAIERGMWWTLKVHGLMPMYYHGMLKGRM